MKYFKTKRNYHDADITGYRWQDDDLILEINQRYRPTFSSEVQFLNVKNKDEVDESLTDKSKSPAFSQKVIANIFSIEKSDKQAFTVHATPGPSIKIICSSILEL